MGQHIVMVGVGHVFDIADEVTAIVRAAAPDVVALELDRGRLQGLLSSEKNSLRGQPLLYRILATVQQHIAAKYGVTTGSEMKAAAVAAREHDIGILCIDMDVQHLFRQLWYGLPLKRKISLLFGGLFSFRLKKEKVEQELKSFEQDPTKYLEQLRTYFPEVGSILIDQRNEFMADRLAQALRLYDTILVFVGEGHVSGLASLLKGTATITIIHLSHVRNGTWSQLLGE